jgi:uncharacterized protein YqeY
VSLHERIRDDLREAMRAGQAERRDTLRLLLAELRNDEIERQRQALEAEHQRLGRELSEQEARSFAAARPQELMDEQVHAVLLRLSKRHRQSIEEFRRAGRDDLAAHEEAQLGFLQGYLPPPIGSDELAARVRAAIQETGASGRKDLGRVMARLADLRGRADMSEASRIAQSLLG